MAGCGDTAALVAHVAKLVGGVLLVLATVGIGIPLLAPPRRSRCTMSASSQARGIQQSLVIWAQTNNQRYPGLDRDGSVVGASVEVRFQALLEDDYFAGEYAISPGELKTAWTLGTVTTDNYSYALSAIGGERSAGRWFAWKADEDGERVVVSDRRIPNGRGYRSVNTAPAPNAIDWKGAVAFNDGHADFLPITFVGDDDLFEPASDSDAYQIYSGE